MSLRHYRQLNSLAINTGQFKRIQFPYHTGQQTGAAPVFQAITFAANVDGRRVVQ
jgi:hypothetical protein